MSWFSNISFQRKLRLSMMLTSTVALLLAGLLFLVLEYYSDRRQLEQSTRTLARIAGDNSTAALAFGDPEAAAETLAALRAEPQITTSAIYDVDGSLFASYVTGDRTVAPRLSENFEELTFEGQYLSARMPILEGEKYLGTIVLEASTRQIIEQARSLVGVMIVVLLGTIAVVSLLALWLQRSLSRPISELVSTVGAITARQDWSLRAQRYGNDEFGILTDDINTMLARTDEALTALRESEAQLRLVTDNAPVLLARIDRKLRYRFINRPHAHAFGLTPEEVIGLAVGDLLGEEVLREGLPNMEAALRGEQVDFETAFTSPHSGKRWLEVSLVPEPLEHGENAGFLAVMMDVTERKASEEAVARARDEALAASRAKDDFLAALSHELRTPLSPVLLLSSERAHQRGLEESVRKDFETIRHNVELEARLIDDLLDLTRVSRGKLVLQRRPVNVRDILGNAMTAARPDTGDKELEIHVDHQASQWTVDADAVRLQQIFWNVLKNAVKFTPGGGRIDVVTRNHEHRNSIEIEVRDTGIGMTPAELDRVFESFSQGDHVSGGGSHVFGGLGLGLAIARMLVELHEGHIEASSPGRGQGSTITIELPLSRQAVPQSSGPDGDGVPTTSEGSATAKIRPIAGRRPSPDGGPVRVLLVEDHAPTRASLLALLNIRGYEVEGAGSVSEAREMARRADPPYDLLISDIGLPDGDGCGLMRSLREEFPGLKAVALSGYGMDEDIERSHAAGFSTHLIKPITVNDLDQALPALLEQN